MSEQDDYLINKEKRFLELVRKTLSGIVRDVTPNDTSLKSPLSQSTTEDIIMCFGLIEVREHEMEQETKQENNIASKQRLHVTDTVKSSQSVSLESLKASLKKL